MAWHLSSIKVTHTLHTYLRKGLEDGVVVDGGQEEAHLHVLQPRVPQLARDALLVCGGMSGMFFGGKWRWMDGWMRPIEEDRGLECGSDEGRRVRASHVRTHLLDVAVAVDLVLVREEQVAVHLCMCVLGYSHGGRSARWAAGLRVEGSSTQLRVHILVV